MNTDRLLARDRTDRAAKLATTYLRKAEQWLYPYRVGDHVVDPPPVSSWYWDLLDQSLQTARAIVEHLPNSFFEDDDDFNLSDGPFERAGQLLALFNERRAAGARGRRIRMLENVEGRTPEESALYLAKAREMRAKASS